MENITIANTNLQIDLGAVTILESSYQLESVDLIANKAILEREIDRAVLNVSNIISASGGTALDVLESTPGITVDIEDELEKLKQLKNDSVALQNTVNEIVENIGSIIKYRSSNPVFPLLNSHSSSNVMSIAPIELKVLEKIIKYEAVHQIKSWDDLRSRLEPIDRRCYGFFHPTMSVSYTHLTLPTNREV